MVRAGAGILQALARAPHVGNLPGPVCRRPDLARGEAEQELTTAARELDAVRPATAGQALARLGELRLRQGRLDEAAELFARSAGQTLARLGKAALALERGDPAECLSLIEQLLKEVGES